MRSFIRSIFSVLVCAVAWGGAVTTSFADLSVDYILTNDVWSSGHTEGSAYFQFNVPSASHRDVEIRLNAPWSDGHEASSITLYDQNSELVDASNTWGTGVATIQYTVPSTGDYVVKVNARESLGSWSIKYFVDDAYEPNDDRSTSTDLSALRGEWISSHDGLGMSADEDWYQLHVPFENDRALKIQCKFTHADGDINLELYDAAGTPLSYAETLYDFETINYTVPSAGDYYLRVYGDFAGNEYDLRYRTDDAYEENDDFSTATDLIAQEGKWLSSYHGLAIAADEDWFKIETTETQHHVRIDVVGEDGTSSVPFDMTDADGNEFYGYFGDQSFVNLNLPGDEDFYISIESGTAENPWAYNLRWAYDDAYEGSGSTGNDSPSVAYTLPAHTWLSDLEGKGVQWGDDYYKVVLTGHGGTLLVDCEFTDADGDIELELYNADNELLKYSRSGSDNELISEGLPVGTYYIRVYGGAASGSAGNEYNLRWRRDDWFEENDSLDDAATDLLLHSWAWLSDIYDIGQQCDDDYYKIEVTSTDALRVVAECQFTHADGNIDMELRDASGSLVQSAASFTDNEVLDKTVPSIGTYYLVVTGDNAGNSYDLRWKVSAQNDDYYEDNDTMFKAFDLSDAEGDWLSDHHGEAYKKDDDWYKITVPTGSRRVWVRMVSEEDDANLDMSLYNSAGTEISHTEFPYDYDFMTKVVPSAGTYYIKVTGPDSGAQYDLFWSVHPETDDAYEDNDTLESTRLYIDQNDPLAYIGGVGIQADDDYYRIFVASGYEQVQIDCSFTHADGDIVVALYDSTGHKIEFADSSDDNEQLQAVVLPNATYYVRVAGDNAGNTYNLSWSGSPSVAPSDLTLSGTSVDENQPAGTLVGYLSCTDPDEGDQFTYTLPNYPNNDLFQLGRSRLGQYTLKTAVSFDYENTPKIPIAINVTDGSGKSATREFTITINNLPEETPTFSSSTVTPDGMVMKWNSTAGFRYQIQSTTNLVDGFSSDGQPTVDATPPQNSYTGSVDNASSRFWKISVEP